MENMLRVATTRHQFTMATRSDGFILTTTIWSRSAFNTSSNINKAVFHISCSTSQRRLGDIVSLYNNNNNNNTKYYFECTYIFEVKKQQQTV